jgi:hypothetical protein
MPCKHWVAGSIPARSTRIYGLVVLIGNTSVLHAEVRGSIPPRSTNVVNSSVLLFQSSTRLLSKRSLIKLGDNREDKKCASSNS